MISSCLNSDGTLFAVGRRQNFFRKGVYIQKKEYYVLGVAEVTVVTVVLYYIMKGGDYMPKKRSVEVRLEEAREKAERLQLEKDIKTMQEKFRSRTRKRR